MSCCAAADIRVWTRGQRRRSPGLCGADTYGLRRTGPCRVSGHTWPRYQEHDITIVVEKWLSLNLN